MTALPPVEELEPFRSAASAARVMGWAPYTGAVVVAAVRTTKGEYYGGSNVEVANISLSKHAEEAAIMAALAAGAMARRDGQREPRCIEAVYTTATPCGSCRQFLLEFATANCVIYIDDDSKLAGTFTLEELLPRSFGREQQLAAGGNTAEAAEESG